jgi:hypothetical protein
VHSQAIAAEALRLRDAEGLGARRVARRLGLPLPTVRDWLGGKLPRHSRTTPGNRSPAICSTCGQPEHRFDELGPAYVHLLGLYLGDGNIAAHHRGVTRLRIFLDMKYPKIVDGCAESIQATVPENKVLVQLTRSNCYSVSAYSRSWPCLFPQHGSGPKHTRPIFLAAWQQVLARRWPKQLLKGLIQSDGSRFANTGRGGWRHPRYSFTNVSTDITSIFCSACDCLGPRWTASFPTRESAAVSIYVSRKADVAKLDEFVGPKR